MNAAAAGHDETVLTGPFGCGQLELMLNQTDMLSNRTSQLAGVCCMSGRTTMTTTIIGTNGSGGVVQV